LARRGWNTTLRCAETTPDSTPPLVAGAPETREYRAQGMSGNARVGDLSAVVSVVTTP
jgi:hypothetical protein